MKLAQPGHKWRYRSAPCASFPSLLVVGEIGYLPITRTGAMLFFRLMSRRHEHALMVLTSNKSFGVWRHLGDETWRRR